MAFQGKTLFKLICNDLIFIWIFDTLGPVPQSILILDLYSVEKKKNKSSLMEHISLRKYI